MQNRILKKVGRFTRSLPKAWLFPVAVLIIYAILLPFDPDRTFEAFEKSGQVFRTVAWPMGLVLCAMLAMNYMIRPHQIVRFLGKNSGFKGMLISTFAGIISLGPIYAWYPFLKDLREKGAGNSPIALFLGNRAVKPFLLPMMIAIFGWLYVIILTILTILESFAIVGMLTLALDDDQGIEHR